MKKIKYLTLTFVSLFSLQSCNIYKQNTVNYEEYLTHCDNDETFFLSLYGTSCHACESALKDVTSYFKNNEEVPVYFMDDQTLFQTGNESQRENIYNTVVSAYTKNEANYRYRYFTSEISEVTSENFKDYFPSLVTPTNILFKDGEAVSVRFGYYNLAKDATPENQTLEENGVAETLDNMLKQAGLK